MVESLNLAENLIIKVLDEVGILSFLHSRSYCRRVFWNISTRSQKIRDSNYWINRLAGAISNELFPLKRERLKRGNIEKYVFQKEDIVINFSSKCLVYETTIEKAPNLVWRFLVTSEKGPAEGTVFFKFYYEFDEIFAASLTVLKLSKKAEDFDKRIGEIESNLVEVIKQLSTNQKTSSIFARMEKLEPLFRELMREYSIFTEEVKYLTDVVKTRDLMADSKLILEEIDKYSPKPSVHHGLLEELTLVLEKGLETLNSQATLLIHRSEHLKDEFISLKNSLATRIQIKLERWNLAIQNALGMLQVIAIMVFLFELMKYFYPFVNDYEHISIYLLVLIAPIVLAFLIYRKLRQSD